MTRQRSELISGTLFILGLLLAYLIYSPGLAGPFLFDDYSNLRLLGAFGAVDNWDSFTHYLSSGFAGPTGRPVALISFLLNANDWPAAAEPFKYTNILIHLLNGVLVFWVTLEVLRHCVKVSSAKPYIPLVALVSALAWLFHPYFISTNLYVVQRMAQLPLLFILVAIIFYTKLRCLVGGERSRTAYISLSVSLPLLGVLAACSKENGVLLPVLILAIEFTVFSDDSFSKLNRYWKCVFLQLPLFLILSYLLYSATKNGWTQLFHSRDFSPAERLLTEFRVVWNYLYHLFIPHLFTTGVFHDTVVVSKGLLSPITTTLSILATIGSLVVAIVLRQKAPLVALAIIFFFASQLVESTTVSLELMFEHRAYLGSIFLFLPVVYYGFRLMGLLSACLLSSLLLAVLGGFCWYGATLWSSYPSLTMVWATKLPNSPRAQVEAAKMLFDAGQNRASLQLLSDAVTRMDHNLFLNTTYLLVKCRTDGVSKEERDRVLALAGSELYRRTNFNLLQNVESWSSGTDCRGLDSRFVVDYVNGLLSQPRHIRTDSQAYAQIEYIKGVSLLKLSRVDDAMRSFQLSIQSRSEPQKLMNIAAYLAGHGVFDKALEYSEQARSQVASGNLSGRALAEAPKLSDINIFIATVKREMSTDE